MASAASSADPKVATQSKPLSVQTFQRPERASSQVKPPGKEVKVVVVVVFVSMLLSTARTV